MTRKFVLIAILAVAACADVKYYKPGATAADFKTDSYVCERDARSVSYSFGGSFAGLAAINFYRRCMEARGWEQR